MPYYRIIIQTKRQKKPFVGIRLINNPNINTVYLDTHTKANDIYRKDLIDVEVQMLSKLCTAVKDFIKAGGDKI